jgi:glycosyltransferase involved in cell wall biosynthesis
MKVCFFTTSNFSQVLREQYTYSDIKILKELNFEVCFANTLSDIPFDCDLYYSWWASGSIYPTIIAKILNKPNIVIAGGNEAIPYCDSLSNKPHGYLAAGFIKRIATRLVIKYSTAVVAVSSFMTDGLKALGCKQPYVIYNCVNTSFFRPDEQVKKEFITTSFRLDNIPTIIKRGENFIKAASVLFKQNPNLRFMIIGHKGEAYQKLKRLCDDLGLIDSVIFTGAVENTDVIHYLQRSICFVQPSDTETFGVAIAEAMSAGCPAVISSRGALLEVFGENGIYVDQNSPDSIAEGIQIVLNMKKSDLNQLSLKLRMHIKENYSYENRKIAIKNLLNTILD